MKSGNNNRDVFNNTGEKTEDHIGPIAKNGSPSSKNVQYLTQESNVEKGDRNSGSINGIRFSVTETGRTESGKVIGKMKVLISGNGIDVK